MTFPLTVNSFDAPQGELHVNSVLSNVESSLDNKGLKQLPSHPHPIFQLHQNFTFTSMTQVSQNLLPGLLSCFLCLLPPAPSMFPCLRHPSSCSNRSNEGNGSQMGVLSLYINLLYSQWVTHWTALVWATRGCRDCKIAIA